jgi:hypothetical protein
MAKLTMVFGGLLVALGIVGYVGTHSLHALIPGYFGIALLVCGALANTEVTKRRMLWMHVAVTIGLLGFLGTVMSLPRVVKLMGGATIVNPIGAEDQAATCLLCFVFVALCVRSFINARRARVA